MAWISLLFQITKKIIYYLFWNIDNRHSAIVDASNARAYEDNSIGSIVVLNLENWKKNC